jgi:hypothetical protein
MGLIDVYRINPADQFSVFSPSLKKTQEITYYTLLAKIRGDLNITSTSGNVDNWNQAYDQTIMSGVVTGYTTKTITLTRRDGTEISFDFQDLSPASEDTLDMVTTRGNNTVNIINVGGVSTPWLDLDTSYTGTTEVGRFSWNLDNATSDLGLNDNVVLKIGQDDMWYVRNESGSAIPRGTAVMAVGTVGASGRILVSPMVANGSVAAKYLLGITSEEIADDADGYVLAKGNLREFNTSAYTAGQVLWCSPTTPGALTATEPAAPNLKLPIAFVVHANAVGMLAVRVTAGSTLSENNQVQFGTLANNDVLTYVSANGRWQNVPISTIASTLAFSTIAVTGQPSIVAETNQDTLNIASGTAISLTTNASTDTLTITNTAPDQIVSLTGTGTTTITGTYPNFTINSDDQYDGTVTSVALTAPSAFTVTGSPITTSGTIALGAAGTAAQYIRGDGQLGDFPTTSGGGSSVSYYLNGSINQGTFGGNVYREFSKTPIVGAGTDFSISADGYIAQFITDANDPSLLEIPGGNWNVEFWFSASSSGGTPSFYVELSKYDGTTFTAIASNSATPEFIAFGTTISQYYTALAVPQTTLAVTDRLALRIYVIHSGRTITLHTEDNHLCQVITTFSTGLNALNGLTKQVQYFATGTSGTDFNISSVTDTHTFNLPTASSLNRGALSSADWITFNSKADFSFKTIAVAGQGSIVADAADDTLTVASGTGITLTTNSSTDTLTITNSAPDQTVVLTAGTGITTSGTYPSFTITNNDRGSSQNIFKNLAVSGQSTIVADNNDDTLTVASGTGISLTTNSVSDTLTITNTAPDQVVSITAGTGMSVSGTYPSFTVINTAPDQVVSITGAGTSVVTGTYPNFTITSNDQYVGTVTSVNLTAGTGITVSGGPITSSGSITVNNSDRGSSQNIFKNIAVPGQTTIVASTNNDTFTVKPGSGISATTLGNDITLSNTDPGSAQSIFKNFAVAGQNTIVADGNNDVFTFVAGTGVSLTTNDTTDSLTVTNSAPDQVVALSSGTGISVSGTYPNFTITNTSPSSGGTVTGTGTTNYVTKWTTSSNIGDSQIFDNGTNVGIGTTTLTQKFHVNGNIVLGDVLYLNSANGAIWNSANGALRFGTNATERARFDAAGNFGIGTASPLSKLHVETSASNPFRMVRTGGSATNFGYEFGSGAIGLYDYTNSTYRYYITSGGNVGIGTTSPDAKLVITGSGTGLAKIGDAGFGSGNYTGISLNGTLSTSSYNFLSSPTDVNLFINRPTGADIRFRENNNDQVVIASGGNVGIGTTAPVGKLNIAGVTAFNTGLNINGNTANGVGMSLRNAGGNDWYIISTGSSNGGGANNLGFYNDNVGEYRLYVTSGGNVGIGTTSPSVELAVYQSSTARIHLQNSTSGTASTDGLQIALSGVDGYLWNWENGSTIFATNNAERVRITAAGNVGIGTTSPGAKLNVSGGFIRVEGTSTDQYFLEGVRTGVSTTLRIYDNSSIPFYDSYGSMYFRANQNGGSGGIIGFSGGAATFSNSVTANSFIKTSGTASQYLMADGSVTTTSNVAPRYVAIVNVSQTAYTQICTISGNSLASAINMSIQGTSGAVVVNVTAQILVNHYQDISITTTSGFYSQLNLRVISNNNESYSVEAQVISGVGATTDLNIEVFPLNGESVTFGGSPTTPGTTLVHTTRQGLYVSASEPISVSSSGDIYAATNVGIGTTSPASMLNISGTGNTFTRYTNTTNAGHFMDVGSNSSGQHFIFGYGAYPMLFGTNGSEVVRITSGGNVGIGTTTPNGKLQVDGDFYVNGIDRKIMNYNGAVDYGTLTNNSVRFNQNGVERARISTTGNVGIGTTSPSSLLEIAGASPVLTINRTSGTSSTINFNSSGSNFASIISNPSNGENRFSIGPAAAWGGFHTFYTDTSERMRITAAGNVGIGTTNPGAKLDVVGNTYIRSGILYVDTIASYSTTNVSLASATNLIIPSGNVGIGTTSPNLNATGSVLHINTSANNASAIHFTNATTGTTATDGLIIGRFGDNINYLYTYENEALHFGTNNGVRMVISAAGSVGIGNTSPGAPLDVTGNARATTLSTTSGLGLNVGAYAYLSQTISGVMTFLGHNVRASDSVANTAVVQNGSWISSLIKLYYNEGITFHTDTTVYAAGATYPLATTERMRIQTNGNVGIGTTSVFSRFTVSGALTASSSQMSIVNTEGGHAIIRAGIAGISNSGISLVTANVDGSSQNVRMVVSATGSVGIGTTSPSASLHIAASGGVIFGATTGAVGTSQITTASAGSPVSSRFAFGTDGSGWQYRIAKNTAGTIVDLITVADNGRVGIGTTSPSTLLHVEGRIYAGDIGIATTSPTQKLHVVGNARITGAIFDSFNSSGSAGQVLSSTGTGTEWVTGGGGGGGSTIIVKDEGTTIGSSFTTLNFIGDNVNATASGSTAVIEVSGRASSGSVYYDDVATPFVIPGSGFADVEINAQTVMATVPSSLTGSNKLMATITFGVSNVSLYEAFNGFKFRLYNSGPMSDVQGTTHSWNGFMSKDEGCTTTVFTFHIPIDPSVVAGGDTIVVQADALTNYTPEIYYCALTLMEGTT